MESSEHLSRRARAILANSDNRVLISAAVAWELAIKVNLGKITPPAPIDELPKVVERQKFVELAISISHAVAAGLLPLHHRDPFDRLLIAQAQSLDVPIVSADTAFDQYEVSRLW